MQQILHRARNRAFLLTNAYGLSKHTENSRIGFNDFDTNVVWDWNMQCTVDHNTHTAAHKHTNTPNTLANMVC